MELFGVPEEIREAPLVLHLPVQKIVLSGILTEDLNGQENHAESRNYFLET